MLFYLIPVLQIFCIYHLIRNRNHNYWFFIIIFIPAIGSLIYIFTQILDAKKISNISEEVTNIINPTKKIIELEKQLKFSDTFQNRVNLGDAYLENKDYENAVKYYERALDSAFSNDVYTINKLIKAYRFINNFEKVISYSEKIKSHTEFRKSQYYYAIALEKLDRLNEAEIEFEKIDVSYSNYEERVYFAEFLLRVEKKQKALDLLNQIINESSNITRANWRRHKDSILKAQHLLNQI